MALAINVVLVDGQAVDDQLLTIDETEPNYDRVRVPRFCSIRLTSGQAVSGCWLYVSRHGYLIGPSGEPRKLIGQAALISSLLAEVPGLAELAGTSPEEWISRVRNKQVRDDIRDLFRSAGIVRSSGQDVWTVGGHPDPPARGHEEDTMAVTERDRTR